MLIYSKRLFTQRRCVRPIIIVKGTVCGGNSEAALIHTSSYNIVTTLMCETESETVTRKDTEREREFQVVAIKCTYILEGRGMYTLTLIYIIYTYMYMYVCNIYILYT